MPPEYVIRALRMALGVFLTLAIGYCAINPQLVGAYWQAYVCPNVTMFFLITLSLVMYTFRTLNRCFLRSRTAWVCVRRAGQGPEGKRMASLVGKGAVAAAITCVVSCCNVVDGA
jgi:hypothetical protein